jgi:hypothetical protein
MRAFKLGVLGIAIGIGGAGLSACADDPRYMDPDQVVEFGNDPNAMGMPATASMTLPVRLPIQKDMDEAAALQAKYPNIQIPYVRVGDLAVDVEYTVTNLSDKDGIAFVDLNGANEYFTYVPSVFVVDPEEDPPPPPLVGHVPIHVAAGRSVTDVFREDQLREASIDLDMITRGHLNPFAAILTPSGDASEFQPVELIDPTMPDLGTRPVGDAIPAAAWAQLVRFDFAFTADQHMSLQYSVRVRDKRGLLHKLLLDAPTGELQAFAPAAYMPPPPPP